MIHFPKLFLEHTPGTVLTTDALKSIGISPQLAHHYVKQKWLVPIGDGAYLRQNDQPSWFGALSTLQNSEIPVYVAAGQALDLTGANQNIIFGKPFVHLFTPHEIRLPKWFLNYDFGASFLVTRTQKYREDHLIQHTETSLQIKISRPEQAILEVCRFVPKVYSFENLRNYMESLVSLNPTIMQELLEAEEFIKAKKLFLDMAYHIQHPWKKKLVLERINLGKGARKTVSKKHYSPARRDSAPGEF